MAKTIAVFGATGKQGGAVLNALHQEHGGQDVQIIAVHRKPESATSLKKKFPRIQTVLGDMDDASAVFRNMKTSPQAIYFMTPNGKKEVAEGKGIIDAAVRAKVEHIVMSSVDRGPGGSIHSGVEHWDTKHEIESYLRSQNGTTYTIIRPTAFLENFAPGFNGKVFATVWRDFLDGRRMKLVSCRDVGIVAANALASPHSPQYKNAEINLAGDNLSFIEANKIFQQATKGNSIPTTNKLLVWLLVWMVKDLNQMAGFLKTTGYGAEVGYGGKDMLDWERWVAQSEHAGPRTM